MKHTLALLTFASCTLPPEDVSTFPGSTGGADDESSASSTPTSGWSSPVATTTESADPATSSGLGSSTGDGSEGTTEVWAPSEPYCGDGNVDLDEECDGSYGCIDCEQFLLPVFVTGSKLEASELGGGAGGMLGADAACQDEADSAGLSGRYKAWLSTSGSSPARRFVPRPGAGYVLLHQQELVAPSWDDLLSGFGAFGIDENANGVVVEDPLFEVWTATGPDGKLAGSGTCGDWTSHEGTTVRGLAKAHVAPTWTHWTPGVSPLEIECRATELALYCFGQWDDCGAKACVAARAACEDADQGPECGAGCGLDPLQTCFDSLAACVDFDCPITAELCGEVFADCA